MAGAVKHMERSHRSYRKPEMNGIYVRFARKASTNKYAKESRMGLGQLMAGVFRKMMPQRKTDK